MSKPSFDELLKKARNALGADKATTSAAELAAAMEAILDETSEARTAVETGLRAEVLDEIVGGPVERPFALLDAGIELTNRKLIDVSTPYLMFEEMTNSLPSRKIAEYFPMIEARVIALSSSPSFAVGQVRLVLLRTCVEFLRRCSRIQDNALCGRMSVLLATAFPLSEKSGLNARGNYNTANTTEYVKDGDSHGDALDVMPVDWELYRRFWSLQHYLSRPFEVESAEVWDAVAPSIEIVLSTFESAPLLVSDSVESRTATTERFVKFLTDPHLLRLQLGDPSFRRHILTQFLILLRHIRGVQRPAEALDDARSVPTEAALSKKAFSLLDAIPPNGKDFTTGIMKNLYWERHWVKWKAEGCKAFDRAPLNFTDSAARRKRKVQSFDTAEPGRGGKLDESQLEIEWKPATAAERVDDLRSWSDMAPSVDTIKAQLKDDQDEEDPLMKRKNSRPYVWKTLRVLERRELPLVKKITEDDGDLDAILKADKPAKVTPKKPADAAAAAT